MVAGKWDQVLLLFTRLTSFFKQLYLVHAHVAVVFAFQDLTRLFSLFACSVSLKWDFSSSYSEREEVTTIRFQVGAFFAFLISISGET